MNARKRFYKSVAVSPALGIELDGRQVKTPGKAALILPTAALAGAVAAEWDAQADVISPGRMPLTKLANTAIDRAGPDRNRILAELTEYADSDLVCYRADRPPDLVELHRLLWDPVVDWARNELAAPIAVRTSVTHKPQPPDALVAVGAALKKLGHFELAGLYTITTLTGSVLIALKMSANRLSPDAAWTAAHADEDYQIAQWGSDAEAAERRARRMAEFLACWRFVELSRA